MTFYEILTLLLLGFWTPLMIAAYAYWLLIGRWSARERREELEMAYLSNLRQRRDKAPAEEFGPAFLREFALDLSVRLEHTVRDALGQVKLEKTIERSIGDILPRVMQENTGQPRGPDAHDPDGVADSRQLIREIGHSLNTPLSQIEASALGLKASAESGVADASRVASAMEQIVTSLALCKSVISAFREVAFVSRSASAWSYSSLATAVASAIELYAHSHSKDVVTHIDVPGEIEGYSNNFILAVLLPLLENAVEAVPSGGLLTVVYADGAEHINVSVRNDLANVPKWGGDIYRPGFTTKDNHEGIGLSMVNHFLSGLVGAGVSHRIDDNGVEFSVVLPKEDRS